MRKEAYLISYTFLFCLVSLLMFWYFPAYHKSFIWQQDGLKQHYNGLLYYSRYLKDIISTLLSGGGFRLPMWDHSVGYGSDIITTFHYYAIGDPLTLLSVFVPLSLMEFFYAFLLFLRAFIGGLGFSALSLSRANSRFYTLLGALIYCFSAYTLVSGLMHGIFMVPVCYFPWMIYGIDRIFKGRSPAVFIISTAAAAAANFYFLYMEALLSVLYIAIRFIEEERDRYKEKQEPERYIKDFFAAFFKFLIYALDAFLLSAVVLLPVLSVMLTSKRFSAEKYVPLLYPIKHYLQFLSYFMVTKRGGSWTLLGYTAVGALAVLTLLSGKGLSKEKARLRRRFLILTVFILIPCCGFALNGFAYVVNRWTFAYALSVAMVIAECLPDAERTAGEGTKALYPLLFSLAALSAVFFFVRNEESLLSFLILAGLILLISSGSFKGERFKGLILFTLLLSLSVNGWYAFSTAEGDFLEEFRDFHEADKNLTDRTFTDLVKDTGDTGFFRTETGNLPVTQNSSIQTGFKGTQFYFSLTSPYVSDYLNSLFFNCPKDYDYNGVESRAALEAVAAVRYFITGDREGRNVPRGFIKTREEETPEGYAAVYENENALPLGFFTDGYIKRSDYDLYRVTGRETALISGAVVEDKDAVRLKEEGYKEAVFRDDSEDVLKDIKGEGDMDLGRNSFTVRRNAHVTVSFEGSDDSDTYLIFSNLEYEGYKEREKYDEGAWAGLTPYEQSLVLDKNSTDGRPSVSSLMVDLDGKGQIIEFYNNRNDYYCGRKNFLVNFGRTGKGTKEAVISFRESGVYSFSEFSVRRENNNAAMDRISLLKKDVLKDIEVGQDQITGRAELSEDKLLMISVPYSPGWKAFVDGKEEEIYRADLMYMTLPVKKGNHSVIVKYETPCLRIGAVMGVFGIILFIFVIILHKRYTETVKMIKDREQTDKL